MKTVLKIAIIVLSYFSCLNAQIVINQNNKEIVLLNKSEVYLDKTNKESINTIIQKPELFHSYNKEFINYGIKNKNPLWVKFSLYNNTSKTLQRTLSIDDLRIELIEFYTINNNKVLSVQKGGSLHRKEFNNILRHNFNIELPANTKRTYYLKVYTPNFALAFKALIVTYEEFLNRDIQQHLILAIFTGILIAVFIYNLFLYFLTKDSIYFYYALYILGILSSGKGHYLLWLHIFPMHDPVAIEKEVSLIVYYTNFMALTMVLFTQHFLQTKIYPKLHKFLNFLIGVIIVHSIVTSPTFLTYQDVAFFYLLLLIFFFFVGFYALYKKNKNAPYFIFGWGLSILAWLSELLHGLAIWSIKYDFYNITETLIVLEVFLFSYAIAKYIKELSDDKEQLSQKLVDQKENENIRLENEVKEKTAYLSSELEKNSFLLQELNHRVKNNMQFITSLYTLKLENSDSSNIHEKLQDVERKVQAMSQVHQMLYTQKNLKHIGADDYFEKIIQNIKASFDLEHVSFIYDIKTTLELEEAIYCGLIVNELVTNALKYAFAQNKGEIVISLREDETLKYLKVQDNGIGMTQGDTSGFGQTLIETLAIEQLDGEIYTDTTNGTKIEISFPKK